jgi:hypothetical protein
MSWGGASALPTKVGAVWTLLNMRVDLNDHAAVEAILNNPDLDGEFVPKDQKDVLGPLAINGSVKDAFAVCAGLPNSRAETGFFIDGNP